MSWCRPFAALILIAVVGAPLSGCGFSPVFGRAGTTGMEQELGQIQIEPIADRVGQILRNQLLDDVTPKGQPHNPRYRLEVRLRESIRALSVQKNEIATRANLILAVNIVLYELPGNKAVFSNAARAVSSYNIVASDYGTISAEANARTKTVRTLSSEIKNRLISYFLRANQTASAK